MGRGFGPNMVQTIYPRRCNTSMMSIYPPFRKCTYQTSFPQTSIAATEKGTSLLPQSKGALRKGDSLKFFCAPGDNGKMTA